ncbi:hypothetical protein ACFQJC_14525 [Haloferax namakaokahaiae]|uniref:Uncharacterized protein n=1 Tax=Haloferax namakaokahaiae TaxID=1748331 RepID=A0ABD5ZI72_9EURY
MVSNPEDSEMIQALATVVASLEFEQLEAVAELHESAGTGEMGVTVTQEERKEELVEMMVGMAKGDLGEVYLKNVAPIENPSKAAQYLGIGMDDWQDELEKIAASVSKNLGETDQTDRELVAAYIDRHHGCKLATFEEEVIEWESGEALKLILARNMRATTQEIHTVADALAEGEEVSADA